MRYIVIPQAMRVIIPPTGNEVISMLKTTSLVTAVPLVTDLYARTSDISNETYNQQKMAAETALSGKVMDANLETAKAMKLTKMDITEQNLLRMNTHWIKCAFY